jgi:hypothetical protein
MKSAPFCVNKGKCSKWINSLINSLVESTE